MLRMMQGGGLSAAIGHGNFVPTRSMPNLSPKRGDTFFDGSHAQVVTALLGSDASRLSEEELDRIAGLIASARKGT